MRGACLTYLDGGGETLVQCGDDEHEPPQSLDLQGGREAGGSKVGGTGAGFSNWKAWQWSVTHNENMLGEAMKEQLWLHAVTRQNACDCPQDGAPHSLVRKASAIDPRHLVA